VWRRDNAGRLNLGQLKVLSAIEHCRTAALGGHVLRCEACEQLQIAYNSCRNRHCPTCQGAAARRWLAARQADLLPVDYYHVVFTLPAPISEIAYYNKAVIYPLLFKIGLTAVLHTWGSTMTHHPHLHCIVPGGGLSPDGQRWIACRPGFFLPLCVLSRLFRRLFLERLVEAHRVGRLRFFAKHQGLAEASAFAQFLAPLRKIDWVVYAKAPFAGPAAVLAYLSRYTHRVAIANSRLLAFDNNGVTFKYKDYRANARYRHKTMTLKTGEFLRRFLLHVLPTGLHRIRHYGLFADACRNDNLKRARELLAVEETSHLDDSVSDSHEPNTITCPNCGAQMIVIETLLPAYLAQPPTPRMRAPP
jgi:hypothetical protein